MGILIKVSAGAVAAIVIFVLTVLVFGMRKCKEKDKYEMHVGVIISPLIIMTLCCGYLLCSCAGLPLVTSAVRSLFICAGAAIAEILISAIIVAIIDHRYRDDDVSIHVITIAFLVSLAINSIASAVMLVIALSSNGII